MSTYRCYSLITDSDLYETTLDYLKRNNREYSWLVSEHILEPRFCDVRGSHHHWVVWTTLECYFSDTGLISRIKRKAMSMRRRSGNPYPMYSTRGISNVQDYIKTMDTAPLKLLMSDSYLNGYIMSENKMALTLFYILYLMSSLE